MSQYDSPPWKGGARGGCERSEPLAMRRKRLRRYPPPTPPLARRGVEQRLELVLEDLPIRIARQRAVEEGDPHRRLEDGEAAADQAFSSSSLASAPMRAGSRCAPRTRPRSAEHCAPAHCEPWRRACEAPWPLHRTSCDQRILVPPPRRFFRGGSGPLSQ
jgi:hypothetical protein